MKTLPAILITTVLASAPLLVACGEKDNHGHSHDNAAEHNHDKEDHGHDHATEQAHKEGDHAHAEGDAHEHGEGDKHMEEGEHGHDHADGKDDHAHGDDHGHAHHGGIVAMVDGVHHELVSADGKVTVYAEALPAGEAVKARLTLLRGTEKQDVDLALAEGDEPRFETDLQLQPGDKVVVQIQAGEGQSRLARFDVPAGQ